MQTDDLLRARADAMINLSDPLTVLATQLDWAGIETSLAGKFEPRERAGEKVETDDLFSATQKVVGAQQPRRAAQPLRAVATPHTQ